MNFQTVIPDLKSNSLKKKSSLILKNDSQDQRYSSVITGLRGCSQIDFSAKYVSKRILGPGGGGGYTSISLTGMLIREQISTTPKNRMTLNSNPKKIE